MTKIALFLPDLSGGGAERVILLLARRFVENGLDVHLILARADGELLPFVPKGVHLTHLCGSIPKIFCALAFPIVSVIRLAAFLRQEKPDTLLSTVTGANLVAVLAKILAGTRTHLVLREAVTISNVRNIFRLALMRLLYPIADKVIALTEHMKAQLIDTLKIPASKIVCIPNPIDFENIRLLAQEALSHSFLMGEDPVIIAIGRLTRQKDFQTLIKSFAALVSYKLAKLVILGDGPLKDELKKTIECYGVVDRVLLPGFDPNPYRWLQRADIFVLSSRWEGHPNALLEAIALAKPIVATAYDPSVFEVLRDAPNMKVVTAGDANELMLGMLEKIEEKPKVITQCTFSSDTSVAKYLETLKKPH